MDPEIAKVPTGAKFRLHCQSVFLTYPGVEGVTKALILARFLQAYPKTKWAICCEETYKDGEHAGEPHFHLCAGHSRKYNISTLATLDNIGGTHGNYRSTISIPDAVRYCMKDDKSPAIHGEPPTEKKKRKLSLAQDAVKKIKDGTFKCLEDVWADPAHAPELVKKLGYARVIAMEDAVTKERLAPPKLWNVEEFVAPGFEPSLEIQEWLLLNIRRPRELKQKQLFIWGANTLGKSHLVYSLEKRLHVYSVPKPQGSRMYFDDWKDDKFDVAVMDEFRHQWTITWLNEWLGGYPMGLPQTYKGDYVKRHNVPTIILSNNEPAKCYEKVFTTNPALFEAFCSRLLVVHVTTFIEVFEKNKLQV